MKKKMMAIYSTNVRGIVTKANELGIKKEDIVSLVPDKGLIILIYYGREGRGEEIRNT